MATCSYSHLCDRSLLQCLATLVAHERTATAELIACISEVDARKLYLPAGYPSMHAYCVGELRLSEDAAYKRIQATRAARQLPAILAALADGRLHLSGLCLLAPHLTPENGEQLLAAATHKSKTEIEQLIAERFPRSELMEMVQALPPPVLPHSPELAPGQVLVDVAKPGAAPASPVAASVGAPRERVSPLAPGRIALQVTVDQETYELVCYAQALMGHSVPEQKLAPAVHRAFTLLVEKLERLKFAATLRPRSGRPGHASAARDPRHIPAHVKRAVWERDGGRCSFVGEAGNHCPARCGLETLWNDGLAIVRSCRLREERPTVVARSHR